MTDLREAEADRRHQVVITALVIGGVLALTLGATGLLAFSPSALDDCRSMCGSEGVASFASQQCLCRGRP